MSGDWIKMRADLFTHPKVVRIASALKADRLRTVGGLMAVWCLFDAHSVDGKLDGYTLDALDDLIGWPGFAAAMATVGWIEDHGGALATPRFDEHNGQSAKRRATETERKRMARAVGNLSAPDADEMRSREEKRREEPKKEIARGSRLPQGWEPDEELARFAREQGQSVETELPKFRDYWIAQPGQKGVKLDWPATWRNWCRNAKKNPADVARITVPGPKPSTFLADQAAHRALVEADRIKRKGLHAA